MRKEFVKSSKFIYGQDGYFEKSKKIYIESKNEAFLYYNEYEIKKMVSELFSELVDSMSDGEACIKFPLPSILISLTETKFFSKNENNVIEEHNDVTKEFYFPEIYRNIIVEQLKELAFKKYFIIDISVPTKEILFSDDINPYYLSIKIYTSKRYKEVEIFRDLKTDIDKFIVKYEKLFSECNNVSYILIARKAYSELINLLGNYSKMSGIMSMIGECGISVNDESKSLCLVKKGVI